MLPIPVMDEPFIHTLRATETTAQERFRIEGESYHEIQRLVGSDDARPAGRPGSGYGVLIAEHGGNRWSNDHLQSDLLFPPAANSSRLLTPILLPPNVVLDVDIKPTGLTPVYNRLDLGLWGIRRPHMKIADYGLARQRPFYIYTTPFNQDFSGTTGADLDIAILSDGAFVVEALAFVGMFNRDSGTTFSELGALRVQILDVSDNERPFMTNPMGVFQVFGQPSVWQGANRVLGPMIFRRNSVIRVKVTIDSDEASLSVNWSNLQFAFAGYKVKG